MTQAERCPQCGEELATDAPEGLCPECLLQQGIADQDRWQFQGGPVRSSPRVNPFTPPEPAELAEDFPQLELLQLLGQGGMGAVYKARQKKLDRLVALKVLPPEAGRDPAFAERFAREARALARLNHPNIVGVHDFGEVGGLFYFVMEYVDGVNLRQLLTAGQLTPEEALKIIPQICDALQYAHEEDIVHRDIKPENILLNKRGRVKIADFGLAKLLGAVPSSFTLTGSQQVMGTPFYMAPEQMQKAHTVDHRADVYSLGVVFYEMLTGELPLGRFAPPSQIVPVDRRLDEVVFRALEKEPEQRYQHISDVKNAVEHIAAGSPARARAAEGGAATAAGWPTDGPRLRVKVPHWGNQPGLLRLADDALLYEFDAGVIAGWFSTRFKEFRLAFEEIESVSLEKKRWLKIRTFRLSALASFPGCHSGEAKLGVMKEDRQAAEEFVARLARRLPSAAQPPQGERSEQPDQLARVIEGPAWGLIATGIAACCFWGFDLLHHARNYLPDHPSNPHPIRWILEGCALAAGVLLIIAGDCMRRRLGYQFVRAASILALVPCSLAALVGIPMGIWALVTLRRPDVRAAFGQGVYVEELPRLPDEKSPLPTGPIRRKVHSFVGSIRSLFFGSRADNRGARLDGPVPTRDYQRRDDAESPLP